MPLGIISKISNPTGFVFIESECTKMSKIKKGETFCDVQIIKYKEELFALKIINKNKIAAEQFQEEYNRVANQIRTLYKLNHPSIITLYYHEETQNQIKLLMNYGGSKLYFHFRNAQLTVEEIAQIARQILQALKFIHDEGYIHRDLSPENILIDKSTKNVSLIDFGFLGMSTCRKTDIGSLWYMAPQIDALSQYNQKVDIWALGIILYEMYHKEYPFCSVKDFSQEVFMENRNRLKFTFANGVSKEYIDFVSKMLVLNPENRANASELLRHPFVKQFQSQDFFKRENTEKKDRQKTQKYQYNKEKTERSGQSIGQLQKQLKRTYGQVFASFRAQKDSISELMATYKQIIKLEMSEYQKPT